MALNEGAVVGTYRILGKLGEGGMGTVYRAVDTMIQREVAIKALRPGIAAQPDIMDRFRSEAVLLAKLNHPSIAQLYAFFNEGGQSYMAMEYVAGDTFEQVIRQGPMEWQKAFFYTVQILDGISHAHAAGILHRDLKPANVMRTPTDKIKLMDFGIAQALGGARLTRQGRIIGTLEYLSPERIQGKPPDSRSDLYSVGVMLFEMLTGRLPFQSDSEYELLQMQIHQPPPDFTSLGVLVPGDVEAVVRTAMEKDPQRRFPDADEFSAALTALLPARKTASRIMPSPLLQNPPAQNVAAAAAAFAPAPVVAAPANTPKPPSQVQTLMAKPVFWLASAGGLVAVAGGILYAALHHEAPKVTLADSGQPAIYQAPAASNSFPVNTTPIVITPQPKEASQPKEVPQQPKTDLPPRKTVTEDASPPARMVRPVQQQPVQQQPVQQEPPTETAPPPQEPIPAPVTQPPNYPPGGGYRPQPPARGTLGRLSDAHSVFVAGSHSDLDAIVRLEIQRQLGMRLRLAPTLADADVVMRISMEQQTGKVSKAGRIFGVTDHAQVRAVVFDAKTQRILWQQGVGDKKMILGAFQGESPRRLAERIVKELRDALGR